MNRAAEETIASEDIQEQTLISREAQATKDVTGERTGAFAAPVRSQLSAAQAVAGVFQVAESTSKKYGSPLGCTQLPGAMPHASGRDVPSGIAEPKATLRIPTGQPSCCFSGNK